MNSNEKPLRNEIVKNDNEELTTYHFVDTEKKIDVKSKEVYKKENKFVIYPFFQDKKTGEVKSKYKTIKSFTFEGFSNTVPPGFIKSATRGYGVSRQLRPLVKLFSKSDIDNLTLTAVQKTQITNKNLIINSQDFEKIRKNLMFITSILSEKTRISLNNNFARLLPDLFKNQKQKFKSGTIAAVLNSSEINNLSASDKEALNEILDRMSLMNKGKTDKTLVTTREKIEKRFIEDILAQYTKHLNNRKTQEETWHSFFSNNSWIFYQLFAYPTVLFRDKAYVGGKTITNSQGKIVDFLYQNKLTRNSALIEIKTSEKPLLSKVPYRGTDVYPMSRELNGAVSQVLDQKHNYLRDFRQLSNESDLSAFNPKCIVLIGRIGSLNEKERASFELLRFSLKDVEIVTFDELFERIQSVLKIFKTN